VAFILGLSSWTGASQRSPADGRGPGTTTGDTQALDLADGSFDTVVCALSLCAIPDEGRAIAEMRRVLRPGGRLLLLDHVAAAPRLGRAIQWLLSASPSRWAASTGGDRCCRWSARASGSSGANGTSSASWSGSLPADRYTAMP
jgi:SAM-dependent methyltransferase